jgi:predicted nucleic acid-binding protein
MPAGPIVPDTSAWVEFLRGTGSEVNKRLRDLQAGGADLIVTGPTLMEVLSGARNEAERTRLRNFFARYGYVAARDPEDYIDAARLYSACRAAGRTLRGQIDCLIAVIAIRAGAAVLHADADFDAIAQHAPLEIA